MFVVVAKVRKRTQNFTYAESSATFEEALETGGIVESAPLAKKYKLHPASLAVAQLDLFSSKVLFVYASLGVAGTAVRKNPGTIRKCCKRPGGSTAGFKWRYATDEEAAKAIQGAPPKRKGSRKANVAQIDPISGRVVGVYESMSAAGRALGGRAPPGISRCCDGIQSSCYGFHWRLATASEIECGPTTASPASPSKRVRDADNDSNGKHSDGDISSDDEDFNSDDEEAKVAQNSSAALAKASKLHPASRAVAQLDFFSSKVLFVYASQAVAATAVGRAPATIRACCKNGPGRSAVGFKWRYATEEEAAKAIKGAPPKSRRKGPGPLKVQVVQIDAISGAVLGFYQSMKAAARAFGGNCHSGISRCCDGKHSSCYGFHWRLATASEIENYSTTNPKPVVPPAFRSKRMHDADSDSDEKHSDGDISSDDKDSSDDEGAKVAQKPHPASRAVAQLDSFSSKVLFVYASQAVAGTAVRKNPGTIRKCCKRPGGSTAGFKWRYATDEEAAKAIQGAPPKTRPSSQKVQVVQIDASSGAILGFYKSMTAAARAFGGNGSSGISRCCDGKQSSCYGFLWRLATASENKNYLTSNPKPALPPAFRSKRMRGAGSDSDGEHSDGDSSSDDEDGYKGKDLLHKIFEDEGSLYTVTGHGVDDDGERVLFYELDGEEEYSTVAEVRKWVKEFDAGVLVQ